MKELVAARRAAREEDEKVDHVKVRRAAATAAAWGCGWCKECKAWPLLLV